MSAAARVAPRAVCVTSSPALRRTLRRTLGATGSLVEFHDNVDGVGSADDVALVVMDQVVRQSLARDQIERLGQGAGLIVIGDSLENDEVVAALRTRGMNHL